MTNRDYWDLLEVCYKRSPDAGRRKLQAMTNAPDQLCRSFLIVKKLENDFDIPLVKCSLEQTDNNNMTGTVITKRPITLEDALKCHNVDKNMWVVERWLANSWDVTNKDGDTFTNYQIKIWFKRNIPYMNLNVIHSDFIEKAPKHVPKVYKEIDTKYDEDNMLEICIFDAHIGKLCWHDETGENFDIKIAQERFMSLIMGILKKAEAFKFNKILFPIGSDFFNTDTLTNTTTGGTAQDTDVRWQKSYKIGRELLIRAIDTLRTYAPVDVLVIAGNHDTERMFYVGDAISLWYSECDNVMVDNSPSLRKYYQYGSNMIGFTHNDKEKMDDLPLLMAQEEPEMWANTKFREFHTGHWHTKRVRRYQSVLTRNDVIVRSMRTMSGTDSWHYGKGYVQRVKGADAFLWDYNAGPIASFEECFYL